MTLIFQIAIGIVLGFFILRNFEAILGLGMMAVIGMMLLAIVGGAIYWVATNESVLNRVMPVAVVLVIFSIGAVCAHFISKHTGLKHSEAGVFLAMVFMLLSATAVFSSLIYKVASAETEPFEYLFLLPIIGLWAWLWIKTSRLIRERKNETHGVQVKAPNSAS